MGLVAHRRLQSRQRKIRVAPAEHGAGKCKSRGVAARSRAFHLGSAGVGKPQHLCDLVEGFPHRVIERGAEPDVIADADYSDDLSVTARRKKQAIWKGQRAGKTRRQRMRLE